MNGAALPVFPNYTQLPSHVPIAVWHGLRVLSVAAAIGLGLLLIVRPQTGLFVLWQLVIPIVPAVFLLAPGLWRNVCPLAALNQLPRLAGFTKGLAHSPAIREYSFIVGIVGFFALVSSRKLLFNGDGMATAILLFGALGLAFVGGVLFRGKSGWCSSVCPMLPVQRLYGQTPFVTVPNSHCRPCVGCTKNCYDFNPKVAYLADQYDDDRRYVGFRRFFAAVFPGFVLAFYLAPDPPVVTVERMYLEFAAYMAASLAAFTTLETFAKVRANTLTALFAAAAFNIYYWFAAEKLVAAVSELVQATPAPPWTWAIRGAVLAVTLVWFARTLGVEKRFVALSVDMAAAAAVRLGEGAAAAIERAATRESAQVAFKPEGKRVAVQPGQTLLAVTEQCGLAIESGCRMGICGADPVAVLEGMEHLSAQGEDEKATLARLGLADNTRLACCARVSGPVSVSLTPQRRAAPRSTAPPAARHDASVRQVIVIGHGIAGVTAADHVRRIHPDCEVTVVGKEKFPLYNRMGITRLIYGRSAMQGLYLLPEAWYADNRISCWLNTRAARIDPGAQTVALATGETLSYDRLILATGSASHVPTIPGFGAAGTFVLREAEDAMYIRAYAQDTNARSAVVAGGGLLGLEAAYALLKLGLRVTVLERGRWPLPRQVDERGGAFLRDYLAGLGIQVFVEAMVAKLARRGWAGEGSGAPGRARARVRCLPRVHRHPAERRTCDRRGPEREPRRRRRRPSPDQHPERVLRRRRGGVPRRGLRPLARVRRAGLDRRGERGGRRPRVPRHRAVDHPEGRRRRSRLDGPHRAYGGGQDRHVRGQRDAPLRARRGGGRKDRGCDHDGLPEGGGARRRGAQERPRRERRSRRAAGR